MASENQQTVSKTEVEITIQEMVQTAAVVELYHAQREVANYLELAYLQLGDHPDVAREVRMTANSARMQHMMTSGLMKKFTATAMHIVKTLIPIILDAVELQGRYVAIKIDRDIITGAFGQIIENAESMKSESEKARDSYYEIQTKVQENLASVKKRNTHVKKEGERLAVEIERETQLAKAAKLEAKQLEDEKKNYEEELNVLRSHRDIWLEEAVDAGKEIGKDDDNGETVLDKAIGTSFAMGGGPVAAVANTVTTGVNFLRSLFSKDKKEARFETMMKSYNQSSEKVLNMMTQQQKIVREQNEKRKEAIERLSKLKELSLQKAELGNVESLREASLHLGDVDKQFSRIICFWDNMATVLKILKEDVKSGEVYLAKIEKPAYADRFKKSISRAENDWIFFGRLCGDYIQESDREIQNLYHFLSAPIDSMAENEKVKRQKELFLAIEHDIGAAYGS